MRKNFGPQSWLFPLPVLMVATYGDDGTPNVMNAAWGGIYDTNKIMLCLSDDHKTTQNMRKRRAFTVSFADVKNETACDYVGIVSANDVPDKFAKAGFTVEKSSIVDAPLIAELPVALECVLDKFNEDGIAVGSIVNVCADEKILSTDGKPDFGKFEPLCYESSRHGYHRMGERIGNAFSDGKKIK